MYILAINRIKHEADMEKLSSTVPLHIKWIETCISDGTVVQAGKWGDKGGIVILNAESIAEAEQTMSRDPLVLSDLIEVEMAEFFPHAKLSGG
jgi:uncharacterized protein YciI